MVKVILDVKCRYDGTIEQLDTTKEFTAHHVSVSGGSVDLWSENDVLIDSVSFVEDKAGQTRPYHERQFWMSVEITSQN